MKLESAFVAQTLKALTGIIYTPAEALSLADRLGDIEEFVAWIFLRQTFSEDEPTIFSSLCEIAKNHGLVAQTTRKSSNYPIELESALEMLDVNLLHLLKQDQSQSFDSTKLHDAFSTFGLLSDQPRSNLNYVLADK
jgi:hypothetical protein